MSDSDVQVQVAFGEWVEVGSVVAYSQGRMGGRPEWGRVIGFTSQKVKVEWSDREWHFQSGVSNVEPYMLILLDREPKGISK